MAPKFTEAYVSRCNALEQLKQFNAAIADFDTAIRLDPNDYTAFISKGTPWQIPATTRVASQTLHTRSNYIHGISYTTLPEPTLTSNREGWSLLSLITTRQSRLERGFPQGGHAWGTRGRLCSSVGRPREAAADFSEVIRINPAAARFYALRADAHAALDEFDA